MTASFLRRPWLQAVILTAAVILAYWNSRGVPFLFDDIIAVTDNPTIRQLDTALTPPDQGGTTTGRPLLNLTLAINYALGGNQVEGYHALNILIHAAATLLLFGLARRTLATVPCGRLLAGDASSQSAASSLPQTKVLAFVLALLWAVHPLLTESVTCVAQRSESLCGLFYLATLYGLARGATCSGGLRPSASETAVMDRRYSMAWLILSVLACLAGMATKEVMVTAPVLALLYDRTFLAGSFARAWQQRRGYYLALAATWLQLAVALAGGGGTRGAAAGFGLGVSPWAYLLTQCDALVLYLRLSCWPHPLVADYGTEVVSTWTEVWWQGLTVLALLGSTGWALARQPVLGFLGAWFFLILAPSSSVVPLVAQTIAEHRMYLPLAAVLALACGFAASRLTPRTFLSVGLVLALAAGFATRQRNALYLDEQALWEDVLAHRPASSRVLNNLGRVYHQHGRLDVAPDFFRRAGQLGPGNAMAQFNLGLTLMQSAHLAEAVRPLQAAVELLPGYYNAHLTLGMVLTKLGRAQEALPHFAAALHYDPWPAELHFQGGIALAQLGHWPEAIIHYRRSLQLDPRNAEAQSNWGAALLAMKLPAEAITHFEAALRLNPEQPEVHFNLAQALSALGRREDAIAHYTEAVRLKPDHAAARLNLGIALAQVGRLPEAISQLEESVRLRPDAPEGPTNLGVALALAGRPAEALAAYQAALRLRPDDAQANYNVGFALLEAGRWAEARSYLETAVRLRPNFPAAQDILRRLQEMAPR